MDSTLRMLPMPTQRGQTMWLDSPSEGRSRWRDISSSPKRDSRPIWMRARSIFIASRSRSSTSRWFLVDSMSMKSMTMRPPMSRMRSWRAISSAASRLVLVAVVSMSLPRVARGVYVDRHQRLGVVDDDAAAGGQLHLVGVGGLDLALDLEAGKERDVVGIEFQAPLRLRRHEPLHVLLSLLEGRLAVHQQLADVVREVVAHGAGHGVALSEHQERRRALLDGRVDLFPLHLEVIEIPLQLLDRAADAGGAHDGAHALRDLQLAHDLAHLVAVLALDAARHAPGPRVVRHQHQEAPGEADEGGERRALGAALLLLDLDDDLLALRKELADEHPAALRLLPEVLLGDLFQGEKAVALRAVIHEAGFERGLDAGDPGFVDVGFLLFAGR